MKIDDSFKQPGSVPFKWEIRPGLPKLRNPHQFSSDSSNHSNRKNHDQSPVRAKTSNTFQAETTPKLKPPPARSLLCSTGSRTQSFRSSSRMSSRRFGHSVLAQPEIVSSSGCFPSSLPKRKNAKKKNGGDSGSFRSESEYYSDLETPSRWSVSSRKSVSPLPSSFASHQSSPRPVIISHADWAVYNELF